MICSKCGAQIPDNSRFCIMCGNKIEQQYPPYQPLSSPAQPQPAQDSSSNIFGVKSISDRHYSLEDIARQQEENKNEIGLASAPPAPKKKKKKKRPPVTAEGAAEKAAAPAAGTDDKPADSPARPWYYDLMKDPPDKKPEREAKPEPEAEPAPEAAQSAPAQPAAPRRPASAGPVFKYPINSPPVPTGLQKQTNISIFGGNTGSAFAALEADFMQRKNSGQRR